MAATSVIGAREMEVPTGIVDVTGTVTDLEAKTPRATLTMGRVKLAEVPLVQTLLVALPAEVAKKVMGDRVETEDIVGSSQLEIDLACDARVLLNTEISKQ